MTEHKPASCPFAQTEAAESISDALLSTHDAGGIVAIIGPPGSGKSRALAEYCDSHQSAFLVPLMGAQSLTGLHSRICHALGLETERLRADEFLPLIITEVQSRGVLLAFDDIDGAMVHRRGNVELDEVLNIGQHEGTAVALCSGPQLWVDSVEDAIKDGPFSALYALARFVFLHRPTVADITALLPDEVQDGVAEALLERAKGNTGEALRIWCYAFANSPDIVTAEQVAIRPVPEFDVSESE